VPAGVVLVVSGRDTSELTVGQTVEAIPAERERARVL
jgi:hypothetical protein